MKIYLTLSFTSCFLHLVRSHMEDVEEAEKSAQQSRPVPEHSVKSPGATGSVWCCLHKTVFQIVVHVLLSSVTYVKIQHVFVSKHT